MINQTRGLKEYEKIILAIFCFTILLCGCQSRTLQNNISQIRIAKAAELEQQKQKRKEHKKLKIIYCS